MNEQSLNSGTEKTPELRGGYRKGAGRKPQDQMSPKRVTSIRTPEGTIKVPTTRGPAKAGKYSLDIVSPGPYTTKSSLWGAVFALQNLNIERTTLGIKPITDSDIFKHLQVTASEIERIIQSDDYKKFRISKSAGLAQQTIADIIPSLRVAMVEFMSQLKIMKKCDECGRVGQPDMKKLHEGLQFVVYSMDKFGLPKIDTSFAENSDEVDIKQVIEEAQALVKEIITWPNLAPQRIIGALVDTGTTGETHKTVEDTKPSEGDTDNRPDEVIHTVPVPTTSVLEPKEIPGNDIVEQVGEDGLVDGGLHSGSSGEASNIQDSQERDSMDFSREE